jgi:hypothetical protein
LSGARSISTTAEVDQFYSETQLDLLVAVDAALPHLANYYHDHYHEVTLACASPSLFDSPGFYLYRYADSAVVPIGDFSALGDHKISAAISHNIYPEFVKFNPVTAHWHERHNRTFLVLMLVMEDFYLTPAQLELARGIRDRTGLNVTYSDNENNQILTTRYGLPNSLDSTMAVIVPAGQKHKKYMMSDPLTLDNAVRFADVVRNGSVTQFWRSESLGLGKGEKDGLTIVSANSFLLLNRCSTLLRSVERFEVRWPDCDAPLSQSSRFWPDRRFDTIFTQFYFNSSYFMQKSNQFFDTIFHQFGTKQTRRNLINFLA